MSETAPRFSVIIATYNRRDYVLEAIRSVKEQSLAPFEIIVVVDGSTDGTAAAVREAHPEVILFVQPNLGPSVAHNTGIALAKGDWVCFLDDDDLWHRDKLQACADFIAEHPDCKALRHLIWFFSDSVDGPANAYGFARDFVATNAQECHTAVAGGDRSTNDLSCLFIKGDSFRRLLERNLGTLSATVVRRDVIIRAGCFSPMQTCGDDWTMFLNVARLTEWETIPRRLGFSRLHASQNTGDFRNGLYALAGQINAWHTGRPLVDRSSQSDIGKALANYGGQYRQAIQQCFWAALWSGNFRLAGLIRRAGSLLLPRKLDYLYTFIPPQVTWRWEHYIVRRFTQSRDRPHERSTESSPADQSQMGVNCRVVQSET